MKKTILVVDDEVSIVDILKFNLEKNGYQVITAFDGDDALHKVKNNPVDCIILDLMLPNIGGLEVCRIIRSTPIISRTPIIMLTAKSEETDKVIGLGIGADDYITKPFSLRELFARIDALIRRSENLYNLSSTFETKNFVLDTYKRTIYCNQEQLDLTGLEFDILSLLIRNVNQTLNRDDILSTYLVDHDLNSRTLDLHISKIRKKIKIVDPFLHVIETIRSVGYVFND